MVRVIVHSSGSFQDSLCCCTPPSRSATVNVLGSSGGTQVTGTLFLTQFNADTRVYVMGTVNGLDAGSHGMHIHAIGNLLSKTKIQGLGKV